MNRDLTKEKGDCPHVPVFTRSTNLKWETPCPWCLEEKVIELERESQELHAKIIRFEGDKPSDYPSWKDAAIAERLQRIEVESTNEELRHMLYLQLVQRGYSQHDAHELAFGARNGE
jgi:hypothetical protein